MTESNWNQYRQTGVDSAAIKSASRIVDFFQENYPEVPRRVQQVDNTLQVVITYEQVYDTNDSDAYTLVFSVNSQGHVRCEILCHRVPCDDMMVYIENFTANFFTDEHGERPGRRFLELYDKDGRQVPIVVVQGPPGHGGMAGKRGPQGPRGERGPPGPPYVPPYYPPYPTTPDIPTWPDDKTDMPGRPYPIIWSTVMRGEAGGASGTGSSV